MVGNAVGLSVVGTIVGLNVGSNAGTGVNGACAVALPHHTFEGHCLQSPSDTAAQSPSRPMQPEHEPHPSLVGVLGLEVGTIVGGTSPVGSGDGGTSVGADVGCAVVPHQTFDGHSMQNASDTSAQSPSRCLQAKHESHVFPCDGTSTDARSGTPAGIGAAEDSTAMQSPMNIWP